MNKRKFPIFISALLLALLLFSSCSSSSNTDPKGEAANATAGSGQEEAPAPAPATEKKAAQKKEGGAAATFSTKIIDYDEDRIHNIQLAAKQINNCVIKPGEVFSFNEIVGKRDAEKGYRKAAILVDGEHSEDVGGGICQLSTTIYNAAMKLDMEILERHSHSSAVKYIRKGKDAAVNYGDKDFKFKNTKNYPVKFKVSVGNGRVTVSILKV